MTAIKASLLILVAVARLLGARVQAHGYGTRAQERVVVSGGRRVTGWRRAENVDGAWRADVGDLETRQLSVDGRRAQRAALGRGLPGKAIRVRTGYATRGTVPQSWIRAVFRSSRPCWSGLSWARGRPAPRSITSRSEG